MRKVSLLCLLGLIATAPMASMAAGEIKWGWENNNNKGEAEVYADAIVKVLEKVENFEGKDGFDAEAFSAEIDKLEANGKFTQQQVIDACKLSYVIDKLDMAQSQKNQKAFCKAFNSELVKSQKEVQKEQQELIAKTASFEPEGTPKLPSYKSNKVGDYGLVKTKYGYAVYTLKNGYAGSFVCFLGDNGTETCNVKKACTNSNDIKAQGKNKSLVFVCGNKDNNHSSLASDFNFSIYRNNTDQSDYTTFVRTAETQKWQLENIQSMAVNSLNEQQLQEQQQQEQPVETLVECPAGTMLPSELAMSCNSGVCQFMPTQCYSVQRIKCAEAAAAGDPANWTEGGANSSCNCGNNMDWNETLFKCEIKQSRRQQLVAAGASAQRLACYDAGKATKWNGNDKSTDMNNCVCVDEAKVWNGKSCEVKQKTPEELAKEECDRFVEVGMTKWDEVAKKCTCVDVMKEWNGHYCIANEANCSSDVDRASLKSVVLTSDKLRFVVPSADLYRGLVANVNKYNGALNRLKALAPERRNTADCNIIRNNATLNDIENANRLIPNIENNVARFKEFNNKGIRFWTTATGSDGKAKYMEAHQNMTNDAIYQVWHTIANTNGYDARMYTGEVTYPMAGEAVAKLKEFFGSEPDCRDVGSNIIQCSLKTQQNMSPVIMRFSYALVSPETKAKVKEVASTIGKGVKQAVIPSQTPFAQNYSMY